MDQKQSMQKKYKLESQKRQTHQQSMHAHSEQQQEPLWCLTAAGYCQEAQQEKILQTTILYH